MTLKINNLNLTEQHLVDVTTTELHEIQGGAIGAGAGQLFGRFRGRNTADSNALGISGAQLGGGIGAIGGGIIGGLSSGVGAFPGAVAGGAAGASLSG